jgi:Ca2+-binding RTX toxin-like protein
MSASAVFDSSFYLTNNADVVLAISQGSFSTAQQHFDLFGGRELRNPNSTFDVNYYSVQNPDVLSAVSSGVFANAFAHFQEFGEAENRAPTVAYASFDAAAYLEANTDIAAAVTAGTITSALEHYITFGAAEGRAGSGVSAVTTNPGSNFTLTSNADTTLGNTTGDDTFVGNVIADNGTGTTLNAGDNLDGGDGTGDTLNLSVSGASTAAVTSTAVTLTGIEKVLVSNFDSNTNDAHDHTFNGSLWSGVTTVGITSSAGTGDTSFTNLSTIASAEMSSGSADLTTDFTSGAIGGTADAQGLALNGQTAGTFTTDAGIETLNVTSTSAAAASTLTSIAGTGITTININADANLTITNDLSTTATTVDGTGSQGNLSFGLGTADLTVTGGDGADTIRIDGSTVSTDDAINAGAGTDKLQLTAATNVTAATSGAVLTNFETLEGFQDVTSDGDTVVSTVVAQDVSLIGFAPTLVGVSNFDQDQTTTSADSNDETATSGVNFTNMGADTDMSLSGFTIADVDANDGVIMNFTATADLATDNASGDDITVTLGTSTAAMASVTAADAQTAFNLTLALADYETVNIASQGGANTVASLTSTDMTTLNVSGDKALTVSALTAASLNTVNASTSTANVNVAALTLASTITGGAGNDTFTGGANADVLTGGAGGDTLGGGGGNDSITGDAGNDQITGGTGNDTMIGGAGNDTFADAALNVESVSGGDGNDTFTIATTATLTSADTISGGEGTDTLTFSEANADVDLTADVAALTNVSSVENFVVSGMNGSDTITLNDGVISAAGGNLSLAITGSTGANTINASAVLGSTNVVTFSDTASLVTTYSMGNGQDVLSMGAGNDAITLTNYAYLGASDVINGGAGTDTITMTNDTAATNTLSATQLGALSNTEIITINHATDTNLVNVVATLNDTIVGANQVQGGTFTFNRDVGEDGTLKITASDVTSLYNLSFAAGDGADTFIGGAGADTLSGEAGVDSLTGGAGKDDFIFLAASLIGGADVITDMDFGTSTTTVDQLDVAAATIFNTNAFDTKVIDSTAYNVDEDVVVITSQAFASVTAVDTFYEARATLVLTGTNLDKVLIWQDTLGTVHMSRALGGDGGNNNADAGDEYTVTDLATMSGLNISSIATLIDIGDFIG